MQKYLYFLDFSSSYLFRNSSGCWECSASFLFALCVDT